MEEGRERVWGVELKKLAVILLPGWLRKPLVAGLLLSGVGALGRVLEEERGSREGVRYELRHGSSVRELRGLLNDEVDAEQRRVEIRDADDRGNYGEVYMREVGRWLEVKQTGEPGGTIINARGYMGVSGVDFVVALPKELCGSVDEVRVRGLLEKYKLAGKRYEIRYE